VLFNTASGLKYQEAEPLGLPRLPAAEPVEYSRL